MVEAVSDPRIDDPRVDELLKLLADHETHDEKESLSLAAIQHTIPMLQDPLSESAQTTHVTASAVVLSSAGVLLHLHKRFSIWVGPGGHVDRDETPAEAVLREVREEAGIVASHPGGGPQLIHVDVHEGPKGHTHLDTRWLLFSDPDEPVPREGESPDVSWVSLDEARSLVPPDFLGALAEAQRRADSLR